GSTMKLTMTKKRALEIIGLAVNHEIKGLDEPKKLQRLLEVTLPELVEAEKIVARLNEKTDKLMQKRKVGRFTTYVHFGSDKTLATFYYELHGGLTLSTVNNVLDGINCTRESIHLERINLICDGDWYSLETAESKEMIGNRDVYSSVESLIRTLNQLVDDTEEAEEAYQPEEHGE
ncbi:MAG: hypothetical protein ACKVJE_17190, partial [Pseudomonadales bacterium]